MSTKLDALICKDLFIAAASNLNARKDYINELNVFPVPDGDTGSNMSSTILSAVKEVQALDDDSLTMAKLCKAVSSGSLKGARGNSGVILSQVLRGLTKVFAEHDEITVPIMAEAFISATESAFKAVMKPKEGTILSVARAMADEAKKISNTDISFEDFLKQVVAAGNVALENTPNQLPILKEAGVVDSGGTGLMTVIEGAYAKLIGEEVAPLNLGPIKKTVKKESVANGHGSSYDTDIKFTYCTEFIIMLEKPIKDSERDEFRDFLLSIGDSLVFVYDDDYVKIHVHSNHPGQAFEKAITYGQLTNMKIDNMREEHEEAKEHAAQLSKNLNIDMKVSDEVYAEAKKHDEDKAKADLEAMKKEPAKKMGIVAVSIGKGVNDIFNGLGVDYLVEGGQTMNPSTEDMLSAINHVNAENIFIFPNNKNIIMAANQAKALTEDKNIIIIPSTTVPQGISAIISFNPEGDVESNEEEFLEIIKAVKTGQVTYAVRDTSINGTAVNKGDIMGMDDDGIQAVGSDVNETSLELVSKMVDDDSELISIYYGQDTTEADAEALLSKLEEAYPDLEVELNDGGQPVYYYVLSVE